MTNETTNEDNKKDNAAPDTKPKQKKLTLNKKPDAKNVQQQNNGSQMQSILLEIRQLREMLESYNDNLITVNHKITGIYDHLDNRFNEIKSIVQSLTAGKKPKGHYTVMTDKVKKKIAEMRIDGLTIERISRRLKISEVTIYRYKPEIDLLVKKIQAGLLDAANKKKADTAQK